MVICQTFIILYHTFIVEKSENTDKQNEKVQLAMILPPGDNKHYQISPHIYKFFFFFFTSGLMPYKLFCNLFFFSLSNML